MAPYQQRIQASPANILSQIQEIVIHLVLTASDEDNHPNDDDLGEIKSFTDGGDSNLATAKQLIANFGMDLVKSIQQKKLNDFNKNTPIYKM